MSLSPPWFFLTDAAQCLRSLCRLEKSAHLTSTLSLKSDQLRQQSFETRHSQESVLKALSEWVICIKFIVWLNWTDIYLSIEEQYFSKASKPDILQNQSLKALSEWVICIKVIVWLNWQTDRDTETERKIERENRFWRRHTELWFK